MDKASKHDFHGRSRNSRRDDLELPTRCLAEQDEIEEVCERIRSAGRFAFDTEFVMEDRYAAEVCLIQLATDDEVVLVDPLDSIDPSPIWQLVADPNVETIVHAGMEDLSLCKAYGGMTPQRVFDCQIACGLITVHYPLSLSRMTRQLLNVRLRKSQTLTDWRRRPLSPEQLHYAALDVIYLPAVHRAITDRLEKLGRMDWMREEMEKFTRPETYERDLSENILKLKGAGSLDGKGLAIARELVKARDALAEQFNRPVRGVIRDHLIVEIARNRWTTPSDIKSLRGLHLRAEGIRALAAAAKRGVNTPREQWPAVAQSTEETEEEAALALLIGAVIRAYCAEHTIAHQLVAVKQDAHRFAQAFVRGEQQPANIPFANGWRGHSVGAVVERVLAGDAALSVTHTKDGPRATIR